MLYLTVHAGLWMYSSDINQSHHYYRQSLHSGHISGPCGVSIFLLVWLFLDVETKPGSNNKLESRCSSFPLGYSFLFCSFLHSKPHLKKKKTHSACCSLQTFVVFAHMSTWPNMVNTEITAARLNAPCNFVLSSSPPPHHLYRTFCVFSVFPALNPPRCSLFVGIGCDLPPSFSSHPWLLLPRPPLTCSDYNPCAKSASCARWTNLV